MHTHNKRIHIRVYVHTHTITCTYIHTYTCCRVQDNHCGTGQCWQDNHPLPVVSYIVVYHCCRYFCLPLPLLFFTIAAVVVYHCVVAVRAKSKREGFASHPSWAEVGTIQCGCWSDIWCRMQSSLLGRVYT